MFDDPLVVWLGPDEHIDRSPRGVQPSLPCSESSGGRRSARSQRPQGRQEVRRFDIRTTRSRSRGVRVVGIVSIRAVPPTMTPGAPSCASRSARVRARQSGTGFPSDRIPEGVTRRTGDPRSRADRQDRSPVYPRHAYCSSARPRGSRRIRLTVDRLLHPSSGGVGLAHGSRGRSASPTTTMVARQPAAEASISSRD